MHREMRILNQFSDRVLRRVTFLTLVEDAIIDAKERASSTITTGEDPFSVHFSRKKQS
jgi:hypothetical protein